MKKFFYKKEYVSQKGTTLLELLLYVGLVSIILVVSGSLSLNMLFGKTRATALEDISLNARFIERNIENAVNDADEVVTPSFHENSETIQLSMADPSLDPVSFGLENGSFWREEGGSPRAFLSTRSVTVRDLQFQDVSYEGDFGTLRIMFTIESAIVSPLHTEKISRTFYTTIHKIVVQ